MNDNSILKNKRQEFVDMLVQILKEQFTNIKPDRDKINRYLDDKYVSNYLAEA